MNIILIITIILPLLMAIMLFTLLERKLQSAIQKRIGPSIVGIFGILQPLVDGLKLLIKDILIPQKSLMILFIVSPLISLVLSFTLWFVIRLLDHPFIILIITALGSLEVYGIFLGGFSAKNKYSLVGVIRTTSQFISYELILSMIFLITSLSIGSFRLYYHNIFILYNLFNIFPLYLIALIVLLAETNRAPFDLAESESETVAGFFVEHSAIIFALYFLAEYSNMLFLSYLFSILFTTNSSLLPFHIFFYIWIRATFPRVRFDQLLKLCWYILIPIIFALFIFYYSIIILILN